MLDEFTYLDNQFRVTRQLLRRNRLMSVVGGCMVGNRRQCEIEHSGINRKLGA